MVFEKISTLLNHFIQVFYLILTSKHLNEIERNQEATESRSSKP
jgi:hypothetical protein